MRALIVDPCAARATLAALRALAHAGWEVGVGGPTQASLAVSSRWCSKWHRIPPPQPQLGGFVDEVNRAIRERGYEIVFGASDLDVMTLSRERQSIAATVPYPEHERVARAFDKLELMRAADAVGIRTPRTVAVETQVPDLDGAAWMVKVRVHDRGERLEATLATSRAQVASRVSQIRATGGEALVQEVIDGDLMAFTVVADRSGKVLARVQQRAERTWPPDAGASVRACTVAIDERLGHQVQALVQELGWFGLAELQFLADSQGDPYLIDFNGRFYGSLPLAVASGPNLPAIWAAVATGRPAPVATEAAAGIRFQWLEGDLRMARLERRGGVARDVLECLRYAVGAAHGVWAANDPRPALLSYGRLARDRTR